jgi:predicted acetyltransferase
METAIRTLRDDEVDNLARTDAAAWHSEPGHIEEVRNFLEPARTVVADVDGRIAGCVALLTMRMGVPGAVMDAAGVTWFFTWPTLRRRGTLRALMRDRLESLRDGGEAVATLGASESLLYRRYGFGVASHGAIIDVDTAHAVFARDLDDPGRLEMVSRDEVVAEAPALWSRLMASPWANGVVERRAQWWSGWQMEPEKPRDGAGPLTFLVHRDAAGRLDGYAAYRIAQDWTGALASHTTRVAETVAEDGVAFEAIWRHLLGLDLSARLQAWRRPVDDPLRHLLVDPRRLRPRIIDDHWVRIVDVPRALASRRYAREDGVVLRVVDDFCPWTQGDYALSGGLDGAECVAATGRSPDLVLDVAALGSAFLGGVSLVELARAGLVEERTPGMLRRAAAMFSWSPLPWNVFEF